MRRCDIDKIRCMLFVLYSFIILFQRYIKDVTTTKMELEEYLNNKNKKVQELDANNIIELLCIYDFDKTSKIYDNVKQIISKNDGIGAKKIMDTSLIDLEERLQLTDDEDKKKFEKIRSMLRKIDISQRNRIELNYENVQTLTYDGVCQVFEHEIKPLGDSQTILWYRYFENESIDGKILQTQKLAELLKVLNPNNGQQERLKDLLQKIKPKQKGNSMVITDSNMVFANLGGEVSFVNNDKLSIK